jgi:hypothetical protein
MQSTGALKKTRQKKCQTSQNIVKFSQVVSNEASTLLGYVLSHRMSMGGKKKQQNPHKRKLPGTRQNTY